MAKIVRTATKATGGVTGDELARMRDHSALWINRAFRTDPMPEVRTKEDHEAVSRSVPLQAVRNAAGSDADGSGREPRTIF